MASAVQGQTADSAMSVLTVNGLTAAEPLIIQGKDEIIIRVAGAEVNEPSYSVVCEGEGVLELLAEPNSSGDEPVPAYRFLFGPDRQVGEIMLVAKQDMIIHGKVVLAGSGVYKLVLFYCADTDVTTAIGINFEALSRPANPPQTEIGTSQDPTQQPDISGTGETTLNGLDYSNAGLLDAGDGYDPAMDLNADGKINFKDFAILAAGWQTTYDIFDLDAMFAAWATTNPCDDNDVSGVWEYVNFTGIGPCGTYDCWIEPDYSDPCWDDCGGRVYVGCVETQEFDYTCAYNFWFDSTRVGLCVYTCGLNYFQVMKNAGGSRILQTRHLTQDQLDPWVCDEGTEDKYDWQVVVYNDVNGIRDGYCREGATVGWGPTYGQPSACECDWW